MNATQDDRPSAASLLEALADSVRAGHSEAGDFVHIHGHLIVAGLREGYAGARIYRGLKALGCHPPMSERQFRRYVRQLRGPAEAAADGPRPDGARRAVADGSSRSADARRPSAPADPPSLAPGASGRRPAVPPLTFAWDPTADLDDIR
ncbi:hypothetical protein [Thiocystis violacea]|uniref:hypothetical protein n=1 Tax=Thiocystis violacea TaxID=13725 RepID=UPI0019066CF7|nr:hypothetical protein [Thiocystis violacea]MBK1717213.1 hypothetical protein [Thiocystis violacea]